MSNISQNKNNKLGGKMKRLFFSILGVILFCGGFLFTACGKETKGEITLSSDYFVEEDGCNQINLSLNEGDDPRATIIGKVKNVNDGRIKVSNAYENIVATSVNYNAQRDESVIVLTGLSETEEPIELLFDSYTGKADPVKIKVYVYSDILGLSQTQIKGGEKDSQFVERETETTLDSAKFLQITSRKGGDSNRKDVVWSFTLPEDDENLIVEYDEEVNSKTLLRKNGDNSLTKLANISNGKLFVTKDYDEESITLNVQSVYTELFTNVKLTVLEKITSENLTAEYGRNLGYYVPIDDPNSIASVNGDKERVISIVRNDDSIDESKFYVSLTIDCKYEYEVNPVISMDKDGEQTTSDYLTAIQKSAVKDGSLATYVFEVKGVKSAVNPAEVYLAFEISYTKFTNSVRSTPVKVAISDVVDKMLVYSGDELVVTNSKFDIYSSYANEKGKDFNIQLKPDTVLEGLDTYKIRLTPKAQISSVEELNSKISFLYEGIVPIAFRRVGGGDVFEAYLDNEHQIGFQDNSEIYVQVSSEACDVAMEFDCTFVSTQTDNVRTQVTFKSVKAPGKDFEIDQGVQDYLATNTINQTEFEFGVVGVDSADGLYLDYDRNLPIEVSELSYSDGKIKFIVQNTRTSFSQDIEFVLKHNNGRICKNKIKLGAFIPLEDALISINNDTAFGVSNYKYENGSLSEVVLVFGTSIKLNFVVKGEVIKDEQGNIFTVVDGNGMFNTTTFILTANQKIKEHSIAFAFNGFDENHVEKTIVKTLKIESYVPVSSIQPQDSTAKLIAEDSLSAEDYNLSVKQISINLRSDNLEVDYNELDLFTVYSVLDEKEFTLNKATGDNQIEFSGENYFYVIKNASVKGNLLTFDIVAKSTNGFDRFNDTLNIEYIKYKTLRSAININVNNATRVSQILWENKVNEIYLEMNNTDASENSFVFINSVFPSEAYNKNLTYLFTANDGTDSDLVKISDKGIVSIKNGAVKGGTGYIYVLPADAVRIIGGIKKIPYLVNKEGKYQNETLSLSELGDNYNNLIEEGVFLAGIENGTQKYVSFSNIVKKIKVIVADGQSMETALRIYNENQLKNIYLNWHYEIMTNLKLSNWQSLGDFKGSLRGYVSEEQSTSTKSGSRSDITISFEENSNSLVSSLTEGAIIRDLVFTGEIRDAFVVKTNKGIVSHITIDVNVRQDNVTSSKVSGEIAGAIASANNGEINKSLVLGAQITAKGSAGGVAGINMGSILDTYVELYKFSKNTFSKIETITSEIETTTYAGGLVGKSIGGRIEGCYVYDYSLSNASTGSNIISANAGAMIGYAEGNYTIKNSFAVVNLSNYVGNIDNNSVTVEDAYVSYYGPVSETDSTIEYKSVSKVTNSDYWLNGEGIISYVNGGFAHLKFYQELKESTGNADIRDKEGKILKVPNDKAIFMVHNTTVSKTTLSLRERQVLDSLNTISVGQLFDIEGNSFAVTSSNHAVVSVSASSISIVGKGTATLKVYSKKDYSDSKTISVVVINTISDFKNDTENNTLAVQEGFSQSINYSIKDSIYLGGDKEFDLVKDALTLKGDIDPKTDKVSFSIAGFVGNIYVDEGGEGEYNLTATLSVNGLDALDDKSYDNVIKSTYTKNTQLKAFKGAKHISVSAHKLLVYPSRITSIDVILDTDNVSDDIIIEIKNKKGEVLESNENTYKENAIEKIVVEKSSDSSDLPKKYILTISVAESYKNQIYEDEEYVLVIKSKTNTADNEGVEVPFTLKSQVITHVDMTNYLFDTVSLDNKQYIYSRKNQISSTLSPGNSSFMVVGVDPSYAYYDYFVVKGVSETGRALNISKYLFYNNALTQYVVDNVSTISYQGNALKVTPNSRAEQFVFKIDVSVNIKENCVIPFVIEFYSQDDTLLHKASYDIFISYQRPAEIVINGNTNSVIAKGGSADIVVNVDKNQTLKSIGLVGVSQDIYINNLAGPFDREDGTRYYTASLYAGVNATVNTNTTAKIGNFQVKAEVSRFLNGILEIEESRYEMTLSKISIKDSTTKILGRVGIKDEFTIEYLFDPAEYREFDKEHSSTTVEGLEGIRTEFINKGHYYIEGDEFSINANNKEIIPLTNRLYIINGYNATKVHFNENKEADCGNFKLTYVEQDNKLYITGKSITSSIVKLRLDNHIYISKTASSYNVVSQYFDVTVEKYTDEEDVLMAIRNQDDFMNMFDNPTAENYILMNDIELTDYVPHNTSKIASLDGNGYSINITNFDLSGSGVLERALFTDVIETTTLKNLRVNYYYGGTFDVNVSAKGYNDIKIAGVAINNRGIITNCEVVAVPYTSSTGLRPKLENEPWGFVVNLKRNDSDFILTSSTDVKSEIAGFVINNIGSITNSRVGGETIIALQDHEGEDERVYATIERLHNFSIVGQGNIAGFVGSNAGVIASSFVRNIEIINNAANVNLYTAGFAISNSKRISTSYIQGARSSSSSQESTDVSLCFNGTSISSNGYIGGFVATNTGDINDSYSNILLKGIEDKSVSYFAAGFVYINTGNILRCYSGSKIESSNISQTNFSGVDVKGESLNSGNIEFSYYNGKDSNGLDQSDLENLLQTGAIIAQNPSSKGQYYGFTFASDIQANDGIWFITEEGFLTLTEANQIAFSHRACKQIINTEAFVFPYAKVVVEGNSAEENSYTYGGKYNPIIIRTAQEFKLAMGGANKSTNMGKFCQNGVISGSYRLVSDLNFAELNSLEGVAVINSTQYSFTGILDGNGFAISNISLGVVDNEFSLGLFSQLRDASVLNLELGITSVTATTSAFVGGLAGIAYSSDIVNIKINQNLPSEQISTKTFGIKGANIVGGLVGAIFGDSKVENISITNPIVQATYYDENHAYSETEDENKTTIVKDIFYSDNTKFNPAKIRSNIENVKGVSYISREGFDKLCENNSNNTSVATVSFAGGLIGYADVYELQKEVRETVYQGKDVNDLSYRLINLKAYDTVNVRGEMVGGLLGFTGIHTSVRDAGLIISRQIVSSNLLSYNGATGGIIGYSSGVNKQIYSEHKESMQTEIEANMGNYYRGNESVERGMFDLFKDTTSWDEGVVYNYIPKYLGGLIGYARTGKLTASYSKLNVTSSTEGVIVGGIVGKVGKPSEGEIFTQQAVANSESFSTTYYLNEIYSSGDIFGSCAGGIVGELHSDAKLSVTSINSVNYYSSLSYNVDILKVTMKDNSTEYQLGESNIYAFIGKKGGSIQPIAPASIVKAEGDSEGYLGYIAEIVSPNAPTPIKVIPYEGYEAPKGGQKDEYFKITPLTKILSGEVGYIEMNGYFLGSGNWSTENWSHPIIQVFPSIKFILVSDFIYWDQNNTLEVLTAMKNSTKEIRVRGLDEDGTCQNIEVDVDYYKDYLPIKDFAGKLVGGWNAKGGKDDGNIIAITFTSSGTAITTPMFTELSPGVIFQDLKIKYNKPVNISGSALFVEGGVNDCDFTNVTFDFSEATGDPIVSIASKTATKGLICASATNTSFRGITFISPAIEANFVSFRGNQGDNVYAGLLAGQITQSHRYKVLDIAGIKIIDNGIGSVNFISFTPGEGGQNAYLGLYAGQILKVDNNDTKQANQESTQAMVASANATNESVNPADVKSAKVNVYITPVEQKNTNGNSITSKIMLAANNGNIYVGGYVGDLMADKVVFSNLSTDENNNLKLAVSASSGNTGYVGGIAGKVNTTEITGNIEKAVNVTMTYKTLSTSYIGGLFGEVNTNIGSIDISMNQFSSTIENEGGHTLSGTTYVGGMFGNVHSTSSLSLNVRKNGNEKIQSNITLNTSNTADIRTGGIAGALSTDALNLKNTLDVNSNITITSDFKTLSAGLLFGETSNGGENFKVGGDDRLNISGSILKTENPSTSTDGVRIGGISGNNTAIINAKNVTVDMKVGLSSDTVNPVDPIDPTIGDIAGANKLNPFNAGSQPVYVGGFVGQNSGTVNVNGGSVKDGSEIAIQSSGNTYVGGVVGQNSGVVKETNTFTNEGLFAVNNTNTNESTSTDFSNNYFGGIVGESQKGKEQDVQVNDVQVAKAFVTANYFANAKNIYAGGIVGQATQATITNSVFGGAVKVYGDKSEEGRLTFGGIVGLGNSGFITDNASYGDCIVTYNDKNNIFTKLSTYAFGGIIGNNQEMNVTGNYSLTTTNNDRLAGTDTRGAIVGISSDGTYGNGNNSNLYSHVVCLATDPNGTDVGYKTGYENSGVARGYNGSNNPTILADEILKRMNGLGLNLTVEGVTTNTSEGTNSQNSLPISFGHKLNPKLLEDTSNSQTASDHTNGVQYFYFGEDPNNSTISNQIKATPSKIENKETTYKRAIIGNARVLKYAGSNEDARTAPFISGRLGQNEIISGMAVDINVEFDYTVTEEQVGTGGLIESMSGGTIYAVALTGELSVGGSSAFSLSPFTHMTGGLIDESNSAVNVIYRGGKTEIKENNKTETTENNETETTENNKTKTIYGSVAGFVTGKTNTAGETNTAGATDTAKAFVRNSYSTGRVTSYISANVYAFTNAPAKVNDCYTISLVDQNDHTTADPAKGEKKIYGADTTFKNFWYDINGTECKTTLSNKTTSEVARATGKDTTVEEEKTTNGLFAKGVSGWIRDIDYNYGYATRKFGYLKQSSYASQSNSTDGDNGIVVRKYTRLDWKDSKGENDFTLIPNAGKLEQLGSGDISGNYILTNDIDLSAAKLPGLTLGSLTGIFDGQEHTISHGTQSLFNSISGSVYNLRLTDVNITSGTTVVSGEEINVGALAAKNFGTINNVIASGSIKLSSGDCNLGGIVGVNGDKNNQNSKILNCKNYVKIDYINNSDGIANRCDLGGITAENHGITKENTTNGTITNCYNYAPLQNNAIGISSSNTTAGSTGGIAGWNPGTISNCGNTNSVIAGYTLNVGPVDYFRAGGITGHNVGSISNCYNTAMIKAGNKSSTKVSYAGGIAGKHESGSISNVYNSGVIEALGEDVKNITKEFIEGYSSTLNLLNNQKSYKIKITIKDSINVYAGGISGSGSATNYKNVGTVIRNGVYSIDEKTFIVEWSDKMEYEMDNEDQNISTIFMGETDEDGYYSDTGEESIHITGYDDLGYPTSLCITAKRTIGTGNAIIVQDQTVVSKTTTIGDVYYQNSKTTSAWPGAGSAEGSVSDLLNHSDKTVNSEKGITIGGKNYAIVTDKNSFDNVKNSALTGGIILGADVMLGKIDSSISLKSNISGNGYFINYNIKDNSFIKPASSSQCSFVKDTNFAGNLEIPNSNSSDEYAFAIGPGKSISVKNIAGYGSVTNLSTSYNQYLLTSQSGSNKSYMNYSAFSDTYNGDNSKVSEDDSTIASSANYFKGVSENYGLIVGFDGADGDPGKVGKNGQSFTFSDLTNCGIIKAGNGGNGGRGVDGTIGKDRTTSLYEPTRGTSGTAGGAAGAAGSVTTKKPNPNNSNETIKAEYGDKVGINNNTYSGEPGKGGYAGNTGHGGVWLYKFEKEQTSIKWGDIKWPNTGSSSSMRNNIDGIKSTYYFNTKFCYDFGKTSDLIKLADEVKVAAPSNKEKIAFIIWIDMASTRMTYNQTTGWYIQDDCCLLKLDVYSNFEVLDDSDTFKLTLNYYMLVPNGYQMGAAVPTATNKTPQDKTNVGNRA